MAYVKRSHWDQPCQHGCLCEGYLCPAQLPEEVHKHDQDAMKDRETAFMLYLVLCGTQLVYSLAACFHVVMSCVNTWLMSFLISCVFMSCFAHGWWFVCWPCACVSVLCEYVASVLVFCVPRALMSICLDPTHLVTCLLINFPQLLSLITLIICSLYNLLVFAVPCGFVTLC